MDKKSNWDKEAAAAVARRKKWNKPWDVIDSPPQCGDPIDLTALCEYRKPKKEVKDLLSYYDENFDV